MEEETVSGRREREQKPIIKWQHYRRQVTYSNMLVGTKGCSDK